MMKKMWKMRKDKSAVSPVIATILMVAITVVLAAVLYVMVMGFGGSTASNPPAATLQKNGSVLTISMNPQIDSTKIGIKVGAAAASAIGAASNLQPSQKWTFTQPNTGKVTTGDQISLTGTVAAARRTRAELAPCFTPAGSIAASVLPKGLA